MMEGDGKAGAPKREGKELCRQAAASMVGASVAAEVASVATPSANAADEWAAGGVVRTYDADGLTALVPFPANDANKYTRGTLTALVGSARYPGAACLAATAAQRMGAGYTEVVTASEAVGAVRAASPSLVVRSWEGLRSSDFAAANPGKPRAYLVGSGFDAADGTCARLAHLALKHAQAPVVVDGGGLAALTSEKGRRLLRRRFVRAWPTVVTPHAGEAARLAGALGLSVDDPAKLARDIALAYGAVAMVKGPVTYISDGEQTVRMDEGTPALAKAGTGDVLAGMTAALMAQGLGALDSCVVGATLHARAGRAAADRLTAVCVLAEDVVEALPQAVVSLVEGRSA